MDIATPADAANSRLKKVIEVPGMLPLNLAAVSYNFSQPQTHVESAPGSVEWSSAEPALQGLMLRRDPICGRRNAGFRNYDIFTLWRA